MHVRACVHVCMGGWVGGCLYLFYYCCIHLQVEKEIFDKMDHLFSSGQGDGEYNELFNDM